MSTLSPTLARRALLTADLGGGSPSSETLAWSWTDRRWLAQFPQLSLAERDRRWAWLRAMMEREGVEALIVSTRPGHDQLGHYVTNDAASIVLLPLRGDPVAIVTGPLSMRGAAARKAAEAQFGEGWVKDWRFGQTHADVVGLLKQRGLDHGRIGAVGYQTSAPIGPYMERGGRPWNIHRLWRDLALGLPRVEWIDLFWSFVGEASVLSAEQMAQFKKASLLAELACLAFVDAVKPGSNIATAQVAAAEPVILHGGHTTCASGVYENTKPFKLGEAPNTEMIAFVGDTEAQAGYTVVLGEPSKSMEALIATSEASYRAGLALCRPGVTLRELEAAMEAPYSEGGYWHLAPLYHGLSPMILQGTTGRNVSTDMPGLRARFYGGQDAPVYHQFGGDFVLREGMLIHLEPNGRKGSDSVFLGMNVLITREGPVVFSESSTRVHIKA